MNQHPGKHVVVVGAGLAGLAAAEAVVRGSAGHAGGIRVTLVEASGRVGGILATERRDGWLVERSADSFLAARPEAVDLVERLGMSAELIGVDPRVRRALVLHAGRPQPVPAGFRLLAAGRMDSIMTTPLLSPWGRLRLLGERLVPRRPAAGGDESLEHFAIRRLGREAFERLVQPLAAGIWTADPARLSMAAACPEFFAMELQSGSLWAGERRRAKDAAAGGPAAGARYGQFLTVASGMDAIPRRLAEHLDAHGVQRLTAAVAAVSQRPDQSWEVRLRAAADVPAALDADAVIMALPAPAAALAVRGGHPSLAQELAAIEYAGSAIVSLGFAREGVSHPLDAAGLVVPRCERRRILAVSFSSAKFPGRAPAGSVLLRTFVGGALDPATAALDDARLLDVVRAELRDLLGISGEPQLVQIDRWPTAMPQYTVGHVERVARIQGLVAERHGLALAGAAYAGVGIPQVIASGQAAAATAIASLQTRPV